MAGSVATIHHSVATNQKSVATVHHSVATVQGTAVSASVYGGPRDLRPSLTADSRRSEKVGLRFRQAELAAVEAAAGRAGLHRTEFVRRAALVAAGGKRTAADQAVVEEGVLRRKELRRIGVNVNQMTRLAHEGKLSDDVVDVLRAMKTALIEALT